MIFLLVQANISHIIAAVIIYCMGHSLLFDREKNLVVISQHPKNSIFHGCAQFFADLRRCAAPQFFYNLLQLPLSPWIEENAQPFVTDASCCNLLTIKKYSQKITIFTLELT